MIDTPSLHHPSSPWPHRLAILTAAATLLLVLVGGLVTNTGSGLAVPDWPTTFGQNMFLFPWEKMVGGVFYEHSHRLLGSLVGILTVTLAAALWREPRRWVRNLGLAAVLAVIAQGVLGGLRVVLLEHGLALVHGCFAQAFLGLIVSLVVVTSSFWHTAVAEPEIARNEKLKVLAWALAPIVYLQLVFGAVLTHTGQRLDAHLLFAGVATLTIVLVVVQVLAQETPSAALRRPTLALIALLGVQLSLGLGAYLWRFTTLSMQIPGDLGLTLLAAHRVTGTALWATTVILCLRVLRLFSVRAVAAKTVGGLSTSEAWA